MVALASEQDGKAVLLVAVTKDLTGIVKAGDLVKDAARLIGGSGGGKPDMAQAGGADPAGIERALARVVELVGGGEHLSGRGPRAGTAVPGAGARGCASSLRALVLAARISVRGRYRVAAAEAPRAEGTPGAWRKDGAACGRDARRGPRRACARTLGAWPSRRISPTRRARSRRLRPGAVPAGAGVPRSERLRSGRREPARLGRGVTRRHSLKCNSAARTSDAERDVPAPGGRRPAGTKAIRPRPRRPPEVKTAHRSIGALRRGRAPLTAPPPRTYDASVRCSP